MTDPTKCPSRRLLARGAFTSVEHCRCGAVYVSIGPVSLRLEASALRELAEVVLEASFILSEESDSGESEGSGGDPAVEQSPPGKLN
jgi:hypothetical protein